MGSKLTKSLGKETATTGIRVNCITPAAIKTPLFDQMTPQHIEFMLSKIPLGRFGSIEEATLLVCWLASEECSFSAVFDLSGGRATYWASPLCGVRAANRLHEGVVAWDRLFDSQCNMKNSAAERTEETNDHQQN